MIRDTGISCIKKKPLPGNTSGMRLLLKLCIVKGRLNICVDTVLTAVSVSSEGLLILEENVCFFETSLMFLHAYWALAVILSIIVHQSTSSQLPVFYRSLPFTTSSWNCVVYVPRNPFQEVRFFCGQNNKKDIPPRPTACPNKPKYRPTEARSISCVPAYPGSDIIASHAFSSSGICDGSIHTVAALFRVLTWFRGAL